MTNRKAKEIEKTLSRRSIHEQWKENFRTSENEAYFSLAFTFLISQLPSNGNASILDAGCGTGNHSVRLAKRGFKITGVDFSDLVLNEAVENAKHAVPEANVVFRRENLQSLGFPDDTFDHVLCWGVLMHVSEVDKALDELVRVLRPGGFLMISEGNMNSLQSVFSRSLKKLFGREKAEVRKTEMGFEYWTQTPDGPFLTRHANVSKLIRELENRGLCLHRRISGQFTELYTRTSSNWSSRIIHMFNLIWFKYVRIPQVAYGNIVMLRKLIS